MRGVEAVFRDEHVDKSALLDTSESVDAMVDAFLDGPSNRNAAQLVSLDRPLLPSGYPDHELTVGVDVDAQVGVLSPLCAEGNFAPLGSIDRGKVSYMLLGHEREFMDGAEIPVSLVRQAVKDFLASGGERPTCVEWQEERFAWQPLAREGNRGKYVWCELAAA